MKIKILNREIPVDKKFIIIASSSLALLLVIIIGLIVALSPNSKAGDYMKSALETKDIIKVSEVFYEYTDKSERKAIERVVVDYVKTATEMLNEDFTYDVLSSQDLSISEALIKFKTKNFGDIFVMEAGTPSSFMGMFDWSEEIKSAYQDFDAMTNSKIAYYDGIKNIYEAEKTKGVSYYLFAVREFQKVIEKDKFYSAATGKIKECSNAYLDGVIAIAENAFSTEAAINYLNEAITDADTYNIPSAELKIKLESLKNSGETTTLPYIETTTRVGNSGTNYPTKPNTVTTTRPSSGETLEDVKKQRAAEYAEKADAELKKGNVEGAISNIQTAIELNPNGGYQAKLEEYKTYLPFKLYWEDNVLYKDTGTGHGWCAFAQDSGYNNSNDNRHFNNVIGVAVGTKANPSLDVERLYYNLGGKYDTVTGTIFLLEGVKSTDEKGWFQAYGDGKLIYTSSKVTAGVLPQDIRFSVKGVQRLELRFFASLKYDAAWAVPLYGVANLEAKKDIPR